MRERRRRFGLCGEMSFPCRQQCAHSPALGMGGGDRLAQLRKRLGLGQVRRRRRRYRPRRASADRRVGARAARGERFSRLGPGLFGRRGGKNRRGGASGHHALAEVKWLPCRLRRGMEAGDAALFLGLRRDVWCGICSFVISLFAARRFIRRGGDFLCCFRRASPRACHLGMLFQIFRSAEVLSKAAGPLRGAIPLARQRKRVQID